MNPERVKHLEMLQQVVARMANNSFLLKGWAVTLVSAILAITNNEQLSYLIWLAFIPTIFFWMLDGYFLRQERLFRKLFDHFRLLDDEKVDFSMDTSIVENQVSCVLAIIFSNTTFIFYIGLLLAISAIILLIR